MHNKQIPKLIFSFSRIVLTIYNF